LLGTAASVLLAVVATVVLVLLNRVRIARLTAVSGASVFGLYAALLLTMSVSSRTTTLPPGQLKFFCEIDCHVAFDLSSEPVRAGDTVRLTLRERFRRETISDRRGDAPLSPGTRIIALVSESGEMFAPIEMRPLDSAPLFSPMRPGEIHRAELRFAVPSDVVLRGLLVETSEPFAKLLIGHERSPLHGKVLLDLSAATDIASGAAR
jgi:hypothetical protein